jgi:hypothetical protein
LIAATWQVATHPEWNLDVVFYAALMHPDTASTSELHAQVYAEFARTLPPERNDALARGSHYRRQVSESPSVLLDHRIDARTRGGRDVPAHEA